MSLSSGYRVTLSISLSTSYVVKSAVIWYPSIHCTSIVYMPQSEFRCSSAVKFNWFSFRPKMEESGTLDFLPFGGLRPHGMVQTIFRDLVVHFSRVFIKK